MSAQDEALALAAKNGRCFYVNRHTVNWDEEVLLAQPHKERLCCFVAHPDGTLEPFVQGYSHEIALTTPH